MENKELEILFAECKGIDIREAAERAGLTLRRSGKDYLTSCPAHEDRDPSLRIYTDTNSFYCFSCAQGGDAIKLYSLITGLPPVESAKRLKELFGLTISHDAPRQAEQHTTIKQALKAAERIRTLKLTELADIKFKAARTLADMESKLLTMEERAESLDYGKANAKWGAADRMYERLCDMTKPDLIEWVARGAKLNEI